MQLITSLLTVFAIFAAVYIAGKLWDNLYSDIALWNKRRKWKKFNTRMQANKRRRY